MRPRVIVIAAAALVVGALLVTGGGRGTPSAPAQFEARTISAGDTTVELRPHHIDATGAEVEVTLDTHSAELDMDLLAGARLTVGGSAWPASTWKGDGPNGHHRAGRLRFEPAGRAAGPSSSRSGASTNPSKRAGRSRTDISTDRSVPAPGR